jgi:hypothetical protein
VVGPAPSALPVSTRKRKARAFKQCAGFIVNSL